MRNAGTSSCAGKRGRKEEKVEATDKRRGAVGKRKGAVVAKGVGIPWCRG
jgi:hypothetical protein